MAKGRFSTPLPDEADRKKVTTESLKKGLRIFKYVLPYRKRFVIGLVFLVFSRVTLLVFPLITGKLADAAVGKSGWWLTSINSIAMGLFVIILLQGIFSFLRIYLFAQVSERALADIRQELYQRLVQLPIPFFEKRRVGEITSRITSDVASIQETFTTTLAELFGQVVTLTVGVAIILVTSVQLSLFMLGTFPVLVILAYFFGKKIKKLSKQTQDELAKANVIVEETLQAIHVVKAFANERFETKRYGSSLKKLVKTALTGATYRGAFVSFVIVGLFGGIILVIWYGAGLVQAGRISIGDLLSFIIYTTFIGGSVGGMGDLYGRVQGALGSSERVLELLDETPEPVASGNEQPLLAPINGDVRYENVQFSYPTRPDIQVLKGISFIIRPGEKVALVGPSGAGKSTVVQLLMRFYDLNSGQITVDSIPINEFPLTALRQQIGIVPQETLLFGGTIRENIAYGRPSATENEVIEAARQANALQFINTFPEGLETIVGERGIKLSGGQRQRIAIARAVLKNPRILLLDEATSSLDSESEKLVQEAMDVLMQGRTSVIIAHRLSTVRKADKILVLDQGKIVEQGTHEELSVIEGGLYANLLKLQFEPESMARPELS